MSAKTRSLIVGIDLNREQPQICYFQKESGNTVTAPMKIGNEEVSFRDVFDDIQDMEESVLEAHEAARRQEDLGRKASGIFRQALGTLGLTNPAEQIEGVAITVPHLTKPMVALIRSIYDNLGIDKRHAYLLDYKESFYYHTFYQKKELWTRNVGFFQFDGRDVSFMSLSTNQQTRPITVHVTEGVTITLRDEKDQWDEQFYNMINLSLRQNIYSSIFIQGETFDKALFGRSIALLCKGGRKVFVADNVYARGACYAAREKTLERLLGDYLYVGDDLVRTNIGMEMQIQGKDTYYPLISAGVNWYEADKTCECILTEGAELDFLTRGMEESRQQITRMTLSGLEKENRPRGTTRLKLHLAYEAPSRCVIEVEDLGFGDLFPSSGRVWREVLEE